VVHLDRHPVADKTPAFPSSPSCCVPCRS